MKCGDPCGAEELDPGDECDLCDQWRCRWCREVYNWLEDGYSETKGVICESCFERHEENEQ